MADRAALIARLSGRLRARAWCIATAESCTGGSIAAALTEPPGSSAWFERGFIVYSNAAKLEQLGVRSSTLQRCGAVSAAAVAEMAQGALKHSRADVALAVSGIAGPGGGSAEKPVGTVWLAWTTRESPVVTRQLLFSGERVSIRRQTVEAALQMLADGLAEGSQR